MSALAEIEPQSCDIDVQLGSTPCMIPCNPSQWLKNAQVFPVDRSSNYDGHRRAQAQEVANLYSSRTYLELEGRPCEAKRRVLGRAMWGWGGYVRPVANRQECQLPCLLIVWSVAYSGRHLQWWQIQEPRCEMYQTYHCGWHLPILHSPLSPASVTTISTC